MIVLYVLLGIIAAIVLLFCVKITVEINYSETFALWVKVFFVRIPILPAKKKEKPKKEKPKQEKPKEEKPKTDQPKEKKPKGDSFPKRFAKEQGFDGVMQFLSDLIYALNTMFGDIIKRSFTVEKLFLHMRISKGDAAQTALTYGKTCTAVYPALGYLCNTLRVRQYDADIAADYLANSNTASLIMAVSVRPIRLTNALVRFAFRALVAFIRSKKRAKNKKKQSVTIERNVEQ